jgi:hypothetical protein
MYASTINQKYLKQSYLKSKQSTDKQRIYSPLNHHMRVKTELKNVGMQKPGLRSHEAQYLPHLIRDDEHIEGAVFGYMDIGFAMLVATDKRLIFLDRKPLFMNGDDITYDIIGGVSYSHGVIGSTVTLRSRIKDYKVFTFNKASADYLVRYINGRCVELSSSEGRYNEKLIKSN